MMFSFAQQVAFGIVRGQDCHSWLNTNKNWGLSFNIELFIEDQSNMSNWGSTAGSVLEGH